MKDLNGAQIEQLIDALTGAMSRADFDAIANLTFPFDELIQARLPGDDAPDITAVRGLVDFARQKSACGDLLRIAMQRVPNNTKLPAFYESITTGIEKRLPSLLLILHRIAAAGSVSKEAVIACYAASRPELAPLPIETDPSPGDFAWTLTMGWQTSGGYPLIDFAERLRQRCTTGEHHAMLSTWIAETITAVTGQDLLQRKRLNDRLVRMKETPERCGYLVLCVQPQAATGQAETGNYWIDSYFFDDDGGVPLAVPGCAKMLPGACAEVITGIKTVLQTAKKALPPLGINAIDLRIELILPRDLLCAGLDQCELLFKKIPMRLDKHHVVCLRSFESLELDVRSFLKRRWQKLRPDEQLCNSARLPEATVAVGAPVDHLWFDTQTIDAGKFWEQIQNHYADAVCAVLCGPPGHPAVDNEVWDTLVTAGMPIAVWFRRPPPDPVAARSQIIKLLQEDKIGTLPMRVFAERKKMIGTPAEWDFGDQLTLVWEDPRRIPSTHDDLNRLQSPLE